MKKSYSGKAWPVKWAVLGLFFVSGLVYAGWGTSQSPYEALEDSVKNVKPQLLASARACCQNANAESAGRCYESHAGPEIQQFFKLPENVSAYLLVGVQCSDMMSAYTYCYGDANRNCLPLVAME